MHCHMNLFNVVIVNHSAPLTLSGGKILKFMFEPLEDKSLTRGECSNSRFRSPDAAFSALLLLHTYASYLQKVISKTWPKKTQVHSHSLTLLLFIMVCDGIYVCKIIHCTCKIMDDLMATIPSYNTNFMQGKCNSKESFVNRYKM